MKIQSTIVIAFIYQSYVTCDAQEPLTMAHNAHVTCDAQEPLSMAYNAKFRTMTPHNSSEAAEQRSSNQVKRITQRLAIHLPTGNPVSQIKTTKHCEKIVNVETFSLV